MTDDIWITRDGREVPLRTMDQEHLENLLVYCDRMMLKSKRRTWWFGRWSQRVNAELERRKGKQIQAVSE